MRAAALDEDGGSGDGEKWLTHRGKALDMGCPDRKGKMCRCLLTQAGHREAKERDVKQDPVWGRPS